jgi:hypothetical protein
MGGGNNDSSMMIPNILGSATAGIISRVFTHPLDTAKSRLQATPIINTTKLVLQRHRHFSGPQQAPILTEDRWMF